MRSAASTPSSVTSTSISVERREPDAVSTPSLVESASTTTWRARPTIARLMAASSGSGVVRPWPDGDPVGAEERDVGAELGERRDGVGADGGLGGGADPAGQQVQLDLRVAGQPGGDRDGVGDDGRGGGRRGAAGEAGGGGAGVEDDAPSRAGQQVERGRGDAVLLGGVGAGRARRCRTR